MPIFKRRKRTVVEADPIGAFWSWWTEAGAAQVADAIARKEPSETSAALTDLIGRIHPDLEWELGPGLHAKHVLIVTAAGNPTHRAVARRWLRAAPPSDETWEYADLRRPGPAFTIRFDGLPPIPIDEAVVSIEPDAAAIHVGVHHPVFPDAADRRAAAGDVPDPRPGARRGDGGDLGRRDRHPHRGAG